MGEVEDDDEGSSVEETIDKYLTASCLPMDSNPARFWKESERVFDSCSNGKRHS